MLVLAQLGASQTDDYRATCRRMVEQFGDETAADAASPAYTWYFLAMAHHELGRDDEAQKWLQKANAWTDKVLAEHEAAPPAWPRIDV